MRIAVPIETFVFYGREMLRQYALSGRTETRKFRALFGCSPQIWLKLWNELDPFLTMPKGVSPKHLLWALLMMKVYDSEDVHCSIAGGVDPTTFRKWSWLFVEALSSLDAKVVRTSDVAIDTQQRTMMFSPIFFLS
jgi:hypothetical protein